MTKANVNSSIFTYKTNWDMIYHQHIEFEMSLVLEGRGIFTCLEQEYALNKGSVILIPSNILHTYKALSPIRFAVCEFGNMPSPLLEIFHEIVPKTKPVVLSIPLLEVDSYEALFRIWLRMISDALADKEMTIQTWFRLLFLFISFHGRKESSVLTVSAAADYIRTHLKNEVKIFELAHLCRLTESGFRRAFHKEFGLSPKLFQQQCRMTETQWLLRSTQESIQYIAGNVGFPRIHAFSAWFQKNEGISPTEWRRRQQGNIELDAHS